MIEIYRIDVPKDRLRALPQNERALLLLLGYVSNQLLMLEKFLIYATASNPEREFERYASAVQTQMLVRIAGSAAFEAWQLIEKRFLSSLIGRDYVPLLDQPGREALEHLKANFGKSALLSTVRNNFGFHYPKTEDAEAAFEAAANDSEFDVMWRLYFSHHGFNSLFLLSDAIFAHGIAARVGANDLAELQHRLMNELREVSIDVVQFAQAFFAAAWIKYFGKEIDAQEIIRIDDAPSLDEIALPFFVDMTPAGQGT